MRMRLCVISYHTSPLAPPGTGTSGGMNVFIKQLYGNLSQMAQVDIFVHGSEKVIMMNKHMRIIALPDNNLHMFAQRVLRYHEQSRYDLIHSHYWLSGLVAYSLNKYISLPWIHSFHTIEHLKTMATDRNRSDVECDIMRQCDFIISPTTRERFEIHKIDPATNVLVIPHGVDTRVFAPSPNGHKRLLFVGRITRIKGLDILIEAMRYLEYDTELTIVGGPAKDTATYDNIHAYARNLPVRFIGPVPHNKLSEQYQSASIVIIPSLYESFGLVALEAMASARPIIGFNDTGLKDVLGARGGILIRRSSRVLGRTINRLLRDEETVLEIGKHGRARSLQYDWSKIARIYYHTYEKIIKN